jgi:hypothetical protein
MHEAPPQLRQKVIRYLMRTIEGSGATGSRNIALIAEEMYRDREERLKRFFEGNEVSVSYVSEVLRWIASGMDEEGRFLDANAGSTRDCSVLDETIKNTAYGVLETALRSETSAHENLLKLIQKRMSLDRSEATNPKHASPEALYWKWISQWESYFADRRCEPTRANATALLKRLAKNIDAKGVLRDREGREVTNIDAYITRIARNILYERSRSGEDPIGPCHDAETATLPEVDTDADAVDEEQRRECSSRCVDELRKRFKDGCAFLESYDDVSSISDKAERSKGLELLARKLWIEKGEKATGMRQGGDSRAESSEMNYLRVNVWRTRAKLGTTYKQCVRLCLDRKG